MDQTVAQFVFVAIMCIGVLVWLLSLSQALRMGKSADVIAPWNLDPDRPPSDAIVGERTVRGEPGEVSSALARTLSQLNVSMFTSLFEISERTANRLSLNKAGPLVCNQPPGMYFTNADFQFERIGEGTTRVHYVLSFDRLRRRLQTIALAIILGIGLPTLLIVGAVIWLFVIPSNMPAVRWQVFQTVQIAHALWPPFLVMYLYSTGRRHAKTWITNLIGTLDLAEQPLAR